MSAKQFHRLEKQMDSLTRRLIQLSDQLNESIIDLKLYRKQESQSLINGKSCYSAG